MLLILTRLMKVIDHNKDMAVSGNIRVKGWLRQEPESEFMFAYTLEREAVMIPVGVFPVKLTPSTRAKRGELWTPRHDDFRLPEIVAPGRSGIRVHALNEAKQSEGCIGLGASHTPTTIRESRPELEIMCAILAAAENRPETVKIQVKEAYAK